MMRASFLLACAGFALGGCATTVPVAPGAADVAMPADYAAAYRPEPGEDEAWWRGFGDERLDLLIDAALADNLDIAATAERLGAARELLRARRGDRLPTIDAGASVSADVTSSGVTDFVSGGVAAIFDPDISGRLSAQIQAAAASVAAAEYLVADQRRLVAAAVAREYIELRRTGERLALLDESTDLQERTLRIVTLRYEAGLSANLDVRRAAADLAQTQAQRGLLLLQQAEAEHALAALTGTLPGTLPLSESGASIPQFVGGPSRGVPADLLRRRPDLLVAEARLVEAAALVGVERSDLLPHLSIPGRIGVGDGSFGGLLSEFLLTVGAALDVPLFDGGRRRAEIAAAEYEAGARFAEYRQRVLLVLAEVENALTAIEAYTDRRSDLAAAIEESATAFEQSDALYREGLASLFDVLDAQRQMISSRQSLIDSNAALAASIVALYAAVGASPEGSAVAMADGERAG